MHASNMTSTHVESDTGHWNAALAKAFTHPLWCICIGWVTFAIANVRKRQPWHVFFLQVTLANGMKNHPMITCLSRGVYTLARQHQRNQKQAPSSKDYIRRASIISQRKATSARKFLSWSAAFVLVCRLGHCLCISFRKHQVWTCCNSLGLCTSLRVRRAWPFYITIDLHTTANQCRLSTACINYNLHSTHTTSYMDNLYHFFLSTC